MMKLVLADSGQVVMIRDEDHAWASSFVWRMDEDGLVVRDAVGADGRPVTIYFSNEAESRYKGIPLEELEPPVGALSKRPKVRRVHGAYPTPLTAAVADDLVRRIIAEEGDEDVEVEFTGDDFVILLKAFGKEIRKGLSDDLSPELRATILEMLPHSS